MQACLRWSRRRRHRRMHRHLGCCPSPWRRRPSSVRRRSRLLCLRSKEPPRVGSEPSLSEAGTWTEVQGSQPVGSASRSSRHPLLWVRSRRSSRCCQGWVRIPRRHHVRDLRRVAQGRAHLLRLGRQPLHLALVRHRRKLPRRVVVVVRMEEKVEDLIRPAGSTPHVGQVGSNIARGILVRPLM